MLSPKSLMILVVAVVSFLTHPCYADTGDSILVIFDGSGITGGTGWVDDGTAVRLATDTDSVGIGTTTPVEKLDINGRIRMSQQTAPSTTTDKLYNTGGNLFWNGTQLTGGGGILPTGTSGQTLRHSGSGWSATDNLYNDGTNIGIGTTNPQSILHIKASARPILTFETDGVLAKGRIFQADANTVGRIDLGANIYPDGTYYSRDDTSKGSSLLSIFGGTFNIRVASSGANPITLNNAMYINNAGNVGIGTTTPSEILTIGDGNDDASSVKQLLIQSKGYAGLIINGDSHNTSGDPGGAYIGFRADGSYASDGVFNYFVGETQLANQSPSGLAFTGATGNAMMLGTTNTSPVQFGSNSIVAMTINSSGNVGIGTTSPSTMLEVAATTNPLMLISDGMGGTKKEIFLRYLTTTDVGEIGVYQEGGTGAKNLVLQRLGGNVGIGTTSPAYQLQLSTNSAAKPTSTTWTIASDKRLKTNIRPFTDGLNVILKIEPIRYYYNGKANMPTNEEGIGVIAQDVQKIAPYAVGTFKAKMDSTDNEPTELLDYHHDGIQWAAINAIKELAKQNEDTMLIIKEQQKQIETLNKRIDELNVLIQKRK